MDNLICVRLDSNCKQLVVYPERDFIKAKDDNPHPERAVSPMAEELIQLLEASLLRNYRITFKTSSFENIGTENSERIKIYLNAIDIALRKFFDEKQKLPVVALYLRHANIKDDALAIITHLVRDRLIGRPDPSKQNMSILDLRNNDLSSDSIFTLAALVYDSHIGEFDVSGNSQLLNEKTLEMLISLQQPVKPSYFCNVTGIPPKNEYISRRVAW